jgi:hypothetical protein
MTPFVNTWITLATFASTERDEMIGTHGLESDGQYYYCSFYCRGCLIGEATLRCPSPRGSFGLLFRFIEGSSVSNRCEEYTL